MSRFFSLIYSAALLLPLQSNAAILEGRVVGVTDGDTITLLDSTDTQYKIRLSGIDAPESKQAFGQVSKRSLSELVYDKRVRVDWEKQDRYGRIVGKILVNGTDANLEQVKRGLAWHYIKYQHEQPVEDRLSYSKAETRAQQQHAGLWQDNKPIAPWDWRRGKKKSP